MSRATESQMVSYTLETLPAITAEEREQLKKLASLPYDQIDTSDIPEITPEQAKSAVRGWENHPGRASNRGKRAA